MEPLDALDALAAAIRTSDASGALAAEVTADVRRAVAVLRESGSVPDDPARLFGPWEDLTEGPRQALRSLAEREITRSMDFHPRGRVWPALVRGCWSFGHAVRDRGGPARLGRWGDRWAARFWKAPTHLRSKAHGAFHRRRFASGRRLHAADLLAALGRKPSWLLGDYAGGVHEDPRARGFYYDAHRHVAWGYLLGLDLIPATDGFWCIEANLNTGAYQDWPQGIWDIEPAIGTIFRTAKDMGFKRVWWHAMDLSAVSPWLLGQLREKAATFDIDLTVREDFKVPSRTDFPPGVEAPPKHVGSPAEVPDHTLVLRRNEYEVGSDWVLSHKGLFIRGLNAELRAAGDKRCRVPVMTREPHCVALPVDEGLPNLVYKYPDSSKAEGVFFMRVGTEARAIEIAREIDAEMGEPPGLFQPFVCSRILPGRRLYDIRCEMLLTPLGATSLYAMRREATKPLPTRLDEGRVRLQGVFHANMSKGGEILEVSPSEEEEIFEATDAVGDALVRLLRRGFAMATLLLALVGVGVAPARAQTLPMGPLPAGVTVDRVERPYVVRGDTPGQLLAGLRAEGRGGRWYSYRWRLRWTYRSEPVPAPSITGSRATDCQTQELSIVLTFTSVFPVWERPSDPEPELVEAWETFAGDVAEHWEAHRDVAVGAAHDIVDEGEKLRAACPLIFREAERLVDDVLKEYNAMNVQLDRSAERPPWPPPGLSMAELPAPAETRPAESRRPPPPVARDIFAAVDRDVGYITHGLVVALQHRGELDFQDAFGTPKAGSDLVLLPGAVFAFPAFTEILLAATVAALAEAGELDLDGPLARWLPELDPGLGQSSFRQLLAHRAGLDNALPQDSVPWEEVLDDLDDRALFTVPGAVYSYSRYSYPLALRALERAAGGTFQELASRLLLRPLDMDSTTFDPAIALDRALSDAFAWPEPRDFPLPGKDPDSVRTIDGVPVVFTTVPDLLGFLTAWMEGGLAGFDLPGSNLADGGPARRFEAGVWRYGVGDLAAVSRVCVSAGFGAGFYLFPESNTAAVLWAARDWPHTTGRYVLERLGTVLDFGSDSPDSRGVTGAAFLSEDVPARCGLTPRPTAQVPPDARAVATGAWAGSYHNGDRRVQLDDREGELAYFDGSNSLELVHYSDDLFFTRLGGRALFAIRLLEDEAGRRYVMLGERAFLHAEDRTGR